MRPSPFLRSVVSRKQRGFTAWLRLDGAAHRPDFSLSQRQNALFDGGDRRHQHAGAGLLPRSRFMSRQARAMMHMTGKVVPRKMLVESSMR